MITRTQGDILRDQSEAVVNTVNCVGIMGRGIALQFRNVHPDNYKAYVKACKAGEVQPGRMFVTETSEFAPRYIINFPTKRHWRGKSRMEDIETGLKALAAVLREKHVRSVAIPPLGAGLGGLAWSDVRPRIESALSGLEGVRITLYEPAGAPPADVLARNREVPNMTAGRAALVYLMQHYLGALLDPFVTLLEAHKLMYLMQEAGEPLRLRFSKAPHGPFAENLGHVLKAVEGHLVAGYADGGDAPGKPLTLVPGAYEDASQFLSDRPDTKLHAQRVTELVEGFESPLGMELLATVHWVAKHEAPASLSDLAAKVYAWSDHKRRFSPRQIEVAARTLTTHGWIGSLA